MEEKKGMAGEDAGDVNSTKAPDPRDELEAAAERWEAAAAERKRRQVWLLLAALGAGALAMIASRSPSSTVWLVLAALVLSVLILVEGLWVLSPRQQEERQVETLLQRADRARMRSDLAVARKLYTAALIIARGMVERAPKDVHYQRTLALIYDKLGDVEQAMGDLVSARSSLEKALELRKALAEADPTSAVLRRTLALSYHKLGDVAQAGDDLVAAHGWYEKELETIKPLAEADPSNADWQIDLALSYQRLASNAKSRRDLAALQVYRDRAKAVLDRLEHEGHARGNALFEQVRKSIAWL